MVAQSVSQFSVQLSASGNPVVSRSITMARYLWHLDPDSWPLERIDTFTGEHVPVFAGGPKESLHPQDGERAMACHYPRVIRVPSASNSGSLSGRHEQPNGKAFLGILMVSSLMP